MLFRRAIDEFEGTPIAGTDDAVQPFFSPDGKWIGFFVRQKLMKVAVAGGLPIEISHASFPRGAAWLDDDTIVTASPRGAQSAVLTGWQVLHGDPGLGYPDVRSDARNQHAHHFRRACAISCVVGRWIARLLRLGAIGALAGLHQGCGCQR